MSWVASDLSPIYDTYVRRELRALNSQVNTNSGKSLFVNGKGIREKTRVPKRVGFVEK